MKISPRSHLAAIRFGGLLFAAVMLWAWFSPIGHSWNAHAGQVIDAMLLLVIAGLTLIQIRRYKRDIKEGDGHE
jgi:uncharacterized membrane protein